MKCYCGRRVDTSGERYVCQCGRIWILEKTHDRKWLSTSRRQTWRCNKGWFR
jgi:hypothetical protein